MSSPLERIRKLVNQYTAEVEAASSPEKAKKAVLKLVELQDALKEATPLLEKSYFEKGSNLAKIGVGLDPKLIEARLDIIRKALTTVKAIFQARNWSF